MFELHILPLSRLLKSLIIILIINFFLFSNDSFATTYKINTHLTSRDTIINPFILGVKSHYGFIIIHSRDVRNIRDSYPIGIEIDFNWHLTSRKAWEYCFCYPRTGFFISFFDYDNPSILGYGLNAVYFIEPFFNVHNKLKFSMRGGLGIDYLSKPYNEKTNPNNMSYSTYISGFLMVALNSHLQINQNLSINLSAIYNHTSNGGIKVPNKGINFPTASIGIDYTFNPIVFEQRLKPLMSDLNKGKKRNDFTTIFSGKTISHNESRIYRIYGLSWDISKQLSKLSALSVGTEWIVDESIKEKIRRNPNFDEDHQRGGVILGHEFLLGRFIFSQKIGVYYYNPSEFDEAVYQRYGLNFFITDHIFTGINVKAHRHVADFMDLRLGISF